MCVCKFTTGQQLMYLDVQPRIYPVFMKLDHFCNYTGSFHNLFDGFSPFLPDHVCKNQVCLGSLKVKVGDDEIFKKKEEE